MASKAGMNGHSNGESLKNLKKEVTKTVESEKKCENIPHKNGMNGNHSDKVGEEETKYDNEVERIQKLTR